MLNSKIINRYELSNIIIPKELLHIEIENESIKDSLEQLAEKYLIIQERTDEICTGDFVMVKLEGMDPTKIINTQISIGKGFYNLELEDQLLGLKLGETRTVLVKGKPVTANIVSVKRRMIPAISDQLVENEEIDSVHTVDDYIKYSYEQEVIKMQEDRMYEIIQFVKEELVNCSDFELSEDDIHTIYTNIKEEILMWAKENQNSFEEEVLEFAMSYESPVPEDCEKYLKEWSTNRIKRILIGASFAGEKGFQLNEVTYEKYIKGKAAREEQSEEELKQEIPYLSYLENKYSNTIEQAIKNYYMNGIEFNVKPFAGQIV